MYKLATMIQFHCSLVLYELEPWFWILFLFLFVLCTGIRTIRTFSSIYVPNGDCLPHSSSSFNKYLKGFEV